MTTENLVDGSMNIPLRSDRGLRTQLSTICTPYQLADHARLVDGLRGSYDHTIRVVQDVHADADRRTWRFNCHAFSFDLPAWAGFWALAERVWPDSDFVASMLPFLRPRKRGETAPGDLVVYAAGAQIVHSGVVQPGGLVWSKWGCGHVWEHGLFELPQEFGDQARAFERPTRAMAVEGFTAYAQARGVGDAQHTTIVGRLPSRRDPAVVYEVRLEAGAYTCTCDGFYYRHSCRHVSALAVLGALPLEDQDRGGPQTSALPAIEEL